VGWPIGSNDGLVAMALLPLGQLAGERANKKPRRSKRVIWKAF
jgi:hypothetical protein